MTKNAYIIAGPNGLGKTTFAKMFLPDYAKCPNFVNADLIAQGLLLIAKRKNGRGEFSNEELFKMIQKGAR